MQAVHGRVLLHVGLQSWQQDLKIWYGKIHYTKSTLDNVYDRPIYKNLALSLYGMFFIWIGLSVNNLMTDNWISCNYELSSTMISSTDSAVTASHALQVSTSSTKQKTCPPVPPWKNTGWNLTTPQCLTDLHFDYYVKTSIIIVLIKVSLPISFSRWQ